MKRLNKTEKLAFKQRHPIKKTKFYQVIHCGQPVFENESYVLCNDYISKHSLKNATVKPIK